MIHFIPSWYQKDTWSEYETSWYMQRERTEFDDTVKQMQLFHRSKAYPYELLLLGFTPNLRHFLHRQSVFHAPYFSCFDAIMEVYKKSVGVFSYRDLKWPEGVEFIYSPYVVYAMRKGAPYAKVEFGEDGNMIRIDMYSKGKLSRRNIYDDRGFVASTILFEEEKPVRQDYLMENGTWKIRQNLETKEVLVNPKCNRYSFVYQGNIMARPFQKERYESLDDIILEVFSSYLELLSQEEIFCVAMDKFHLPVCQKALQGRKYLLSFFENRCNTCENETFREFFRQADFIITDSEENLQLLRQKNLIDEKRIVDITPYDSRVDFGISQRTTVQKILFPVDDITKQQLEDSLDVLGTYLKENQRAMVYLFTRKGDYDRKGILLEMVRGYLEKLGYPTEWIEDEEAEDNSRVRFFVEQCVDELSVSKCMREQRLLVDLSATPQVYLQIMAISVGIPQVVLSKTQFVEHGKNGFLVKEKADIEEALHLYLDEMKHWNEAMVCAYEMGKKYTTGVLLNKWKEVIEIVG
ncbi:MAG: accessory Sec system protein Asp1 [Lachnospiraceae bacterium]|nr:accessory Sec system protein Asp1 [Lachnospiraceae bacterium]